MKKILLLIITTILITSCWLTWNKEVKTNQNQKSETKQQTNSETNWKRTYVWFVSTTCPHCKKEMPILNDFYNQYKDQVNMQMIVVNWQKFWDYNIPQDLTNPISYESLTKEKCWYVPSYVIYDEKKNIIDKKCWWALTFNELQNILITNNKKTKMNNNKEFDQKAALQNWDIVAIMKTTNWTMKIKLFKDKVPMTVNNFIGLAKKWYYDWIIFHRVINNFMIQWWDPTWTGRWWESIYWEKFDDEFNPDLKNIKYSISMANAWPNTNWSQFFINQADNNYLDNRHSVFGQVVEWMENVDKIAKTKVWQQDKPVKDIKIISIEIKQFENGTLKDYDFDLDKELKKIEEEKQAKLADKKNREVKKWDIVSVHYTWKLENWEKFDSSYDRGTPLEFEVWAGQMIKWFDKWVIWMKIWDKKTLTLSPEEAYWEYNKDNIQVVPKDQLQSFTDAWVKLEKWEILRTQMWEFKIIDADEKNITLDVNHKLAGKTLIFEVELMDIK